MRVNPLLVDPMLEKIELREKLENLQKENEELKNTILKLQEKNTNSNKRYE